MFCPHSRAGGDIFKRRRMLTALSLSCNCTAISATGICSRCRITSISRSRGLNCRSVRWTRSRSSLRSRFCRGPGPLSTTTTETPIHLEEITDDPVGGNILRADDVDFGHMPGGRLLIGRRFGNFGLEGSWLWTDTWAGVASVSSANGDLVGPFVSEGALLNRHSYIEHVPTSTVLIDESFPQSAIEHLNSFSQIEHRSKLLTGDLGMTARLMENSISNVTLLAGFRYADLEERFGYHSTSVPVPADIIATVNFPSQSIQTWNRLFGPQLGLAIDTGIREKLTLNLSAKTTLAYNEVDRDLAWSPDVTDPTLSVFTSSRDSMAEFLGEFSKTGTLYLTTNLSIHAGYGVLVLSDVALAADNFERNINALNQGSSLIDASSRVAYGALKFKLNAYRIRIGLAFAEGRISQRRPDVIKHCLCIGIQIPIDTISHILQVPTFHSI